MRLLFAALALLAVIAVVACDDENKNQDRFKFKQNQKWKAYKKSHLKKNFRSDQHEQKAFEVFLKNDDMIEKQKKAFQLGQATFTMDHNEMTSMTEEELKSVTGAVKPDNKLKAKRDTVRGIATPYKMLTPTTLGATLDWRDNWTTPIRNQGSCGSCWAFATVAALESQVYASNGVLVDISEQFLVDCSYIDNACSGGWPPSTVQLVAQNGIVAENAAPYSGVQAAKCPFSPYATLSQQLNTVLTSTQKLPYTVSAVYTIADGSTAGWQTAIDQMKDALNNIGPVMACIYVNAAFHAYSGGIFSYASDTEMNKQCNHAIVVVGYGYNATLGGGYWIIRNSWGAWGESGHMRLSMNTKGDFLSEAAVPYIKETGFRRLPLRNIPEGKHEVQLAQERANAAYQAEKDTGCYDSLIGRSWPCSRADIVSACKAGYMSNEFGQKTYIRYECAKTCGLCNQNIAQAQAVKSGCADNWSGFVYPCSSLSGYCQGGTLGGVSIGSTVCKRSCGGCPAIAAPSTTSKAIDWYPILTAWSP